ncbi:MAG: 4Fe-4S dicluster domain-containing protein [Chloroflexi bacterium]|nr:4Fe-4S dicluster domain-containing protein [Chloroflexota bacterium]
MNIEDKLFLDRFKVDEESHLKITEGGECARRCIEHACLYLCPANVYRLEDETITVNYEGCLECGSCRVACAFLKIEWRFPRGGYGVSHKFG